MSILSIINAMYRLPSSLQSFLSEHMAQAGCPAHDLAHCFRVANLSVKIAAQEPGANRRVVYVAGMLHDVLDSKLYGEQRIKEVEAFLRDTLLSTKESESESEKESEQDAEAVHLTAEEVELVFLIIRSVGYKNLLREDWDVRALPLEYRVVQDADLLDAIGAVGIARCFSFGGKRERALFGPFSVQDLDSAAYQAQQKQNDANTVAHFFDKLLRIKRLLSTYAGQEMARERHNTMMLFLRVLDVELEDAGDAAQGYISKYIDMFDDELPPVVASADSLDQEEETLRK